MKIYRKVTIKAIELCNSQIDDLFHEFCTFSKQFELDEEKSENYSARNGGLAFVVNSLRTSTIRNASVAIALEANGKLHIMNISAFNQPDLTIDDYNEIACIFVMSFRQHLKQSKTRASIHSTSDNMTLKNIIPAQMARNAFNRYLSGYPTRNESSDNVKLDSFTRTLVRYGAKVNLEFLKNHLVEDLHWTEEHASRCIERIEIGKAVLRAPIYPNSYI